MTEKEKIQAIKAEIERLKYIQSAPILLCEDLVTFIDDLPEESVSEDLEEAAYKYSDDIYEKNRNKRNPDWNSYADGYEQAICYHVSDAFIEGANWQKEQMMKEAIDAEVKQEYYNPNLPLYIDTIYVDDRADLKRGDKVKLIIIKEAEK